MFIQILLLLLVMWMLKNRWQKKGMVKLWNQLKNRYKSLPFVGHAYMFLGSDEDRMKMFQKFGLEAYETGGLLALWQGSKLYINVSDPAIAEIVVKTCLEKDDIMKCSRLLTGNGSVFAPVSIWRPRRKFLAPTFSPKNLYQFFEIFTRQSSVMVDQLRSQVGKGSFSIWKYITTYTMDSVCESTLGVNVNAQLQPSQPFLTAFDTILKIDATRMCQPWFHNETLFKMTPTYKVHKDHRNTIYGFINQIVKSKRLALQEEKDSRAESEQYSQILRELRMNPGDEWKLLHYLREEAANIFGSTENKRKTFLELLIDSTGGEKGYSDLELQEEILVLVLAGTDTTAVGTAFTSLMLARHPEVQEKVYQEIREIFGDTDRSITLEDLPRLKYLEAVIKETLRLYPSVPLIVRKVTKDLTLPSGITLVKDCGIVINIWAIHRNPKYWGDDAMEFKPERFIDKPLTHPAAFMSFSYGPRGCLGYQFAMMSMKTAVLSLVRKYRIHNTDDPKQSHAPLRLKFDVMMKHVDNYELQLEARI